MFVNRKAFEIPEFEIIKLTVEDVITTSGPVVPEPTNVPVDPGFGGGEF